MRRQAGSGVDLYSYLETVTEHYSFIKFDRQISKLASKFSESEGDSTLDQINSDLLEIKGVMDDNMKKLYDRGAGMAQMQANASDVLNMSVRLRKKAEKTRRDMMIRKYAFFAVIGLLVFVVLVWKIFL